MTTALDLTASFVAGLVVGGSIILGVAWLARDRFMRRVVEHFRRELEQVQCPVCAVMCTRHELTSSHKCPPFIQGNPSKLDLLNDDRARTIRDLRRKP